MYRKINDVSTKTTLELLIKIRLGIESMVEHYSSTFTAEELQLIHNCNLKFTQAIGNLKLGIKNDNIDFLMQLESTLKPLAFKCWQKEIESGYQFIALDNFSEKAQIAFASFTNIKDLDDITPLEVKEEALLGAGNNGISTVLEEVDKRSIYTLGISENLKMINSYQILTPIITPKQATRIILDTRYVKKKEINKEETRIITTLEFLKYRNMR